MGVPYMGVGGRLTDHEIKTHGHKNNSVETPSTGSLCERTGIEGKINKKVQLSTDHDIVFYTLEGLKIWNLFFISSFLGGRFACCMLIFRGVIHFYPKNNPWTWMFNKFEITSSFRRVSKMSKNHPKLFHGFTRWAKLGEHTQLKWP